MGCEGGGLLCWCRNRGPGSEAWIQSLSCTFIPHPHMGLRTGPRPALPGGKGAKAVQRTGQTCQECVITSPPGKHCHLPCPFILTDPSCHWAPKHSSCLPCYLWLRPSKQMGHEGASALASWACFCLPGMWPRVLAETVLTWQAQEFWGRGWGGRQARGAQGGVGAERGSPGWGYLGVGCGHRPGWGPRGRAGCGCCLGK